MGWTCVFVWPQSSGMYLGIFLPTALFYVSQRQYAQKINNRAIIISLRVITVEMGPLNKPPSVKEQKPLFSPTYRIMTAFLKVTTAAVAANATSITVKNCDDSDNEY